MRSASFGRRIVEPGTRELVLVPGQEAPPAPPEPANRDELKEQIRTALMSRIDPSVAARIPRHTLRAEVAKLVSEIATEGRIQLNELEESALAAELTVPDPRWSKRRRITAWCGPAPPAVTPRPARSLMLKQR